MSSSSVDVAVIGAGPYGLAATAQMGAYGVNVRTFGKPMSFWRRHMPEGMILRSPWQGSHISGLRSISLDKFASLHDIPKVSNISLANFVRYGLWVQNRLAEYTDSRSVEYVEKTSEGFRVILEDGERVNAVRLVVAAGIRPFAQRPERFDGLPAAFISHSSDHDRLDHFSGQEVLVVGGGQSALESAALLQEAGAKVRVVVRNPQVYWLGRGHRMVRRLGPISGMAEKVLYPPADVGPPGMNWMIQLPPLYRHLPAQMQVRIAQRALRPAGAGWLRPRVEDVPIDIGKQIESATVSGDWLRVQFDDGTSRLVDHVLLATGFRIDVSKYSFLPEKLTARIKSVAGYPALSTSFESSIPGLHIVGAPAAKSFGPLTRFVAGSGFAARSLASAIAGRPAGPSYA